MLCITVSVLTVCRQLVVAGECCRWHSPLMLDFYQRPFHCLPRQVCPDSAKVQLNMGILRRRTREWGAALGHFTRAQAIEPGYCEPTFWRGLTLINSNQ